MFNFPSHNKSSTKIIKENQMLGGKSIFSLDPREWHHPHVNNVKEFLQITVQTVPYFWRDQQDATWEKRLSHKGRDPYGAQTTVPSMQHFWQKNQ